MKRLICGFLIVWFGVGAAVAQASYSQYVTIDRIRNVMTGNSTAGDNQVWVRVDGAVPGAAQDCLYSGMTLFYVPGQNWDITPELALSTLLTAKSTNTPVQLALWIDGDMADFWGFGTSRCKIARIVVGQ